MMFQRDGERRGFGYTECNVVVRPSKEGLFKTGIYRCTDDNSYDRCWCLRGEEYVKEISEKWSHGKRIMLGWRTNEESRVGTGTEPRRTGALTGNRWRKTSSLQTELVQLSMEPGVYCTRSRKNSNVSSFASRSSCQTRSKALRETSGARCVLS